LSDPPSNNSSSRPQSKLCFVVSPIGAEDSEERIHADWLLELIIKPVMADFRGYRVKRADEDPRPGLIDAQMINDLLKAELVIADLSLLNPNVFYEIGIRHMVQKPIIHMQLTSERPPFDVSLYRAVKFARKRPKDLETARADLKRAVEAVLVEGYEVENPVTNTRGRIKLQEHATSEQQVLLAQLEAIQNRLQRLELRDALERSLAEAEPVAEDSDSLTIRIAKLATRSPAALEALKVEVHNLAKAEAERHHNLSKDMSIVFPKKSPTGPRSEPKPK
jgi:hypothetical protein